MEKLTSALDAAERLPNSDTLNDIRIAMSSLVLDYYTVTLLEEKIDTTLRQVIISTIDRAIALAATHPAIFAEMQRQRDCVVRQPTEILDMQRDVDEYDEGLDFDE